MLENYRNLHDLGLSAILIQIEIISRQILRFSQRGGPDHTSHDPIHSLHIVGLINDFIESWPNIFDKDEIFLLYLGAWLHDTGMIINREQHNLYSRNIIEESKIIHSIIRNPQTIRNLQSLALSHASAFDITKIPEYVNSTRLRLICAIFRILDSADLTGDSRCPKPIFDIIQKSDRPLESTSIPFWEGHICIKRLQVSYPNIVITVNNLEKSKLITNHFTNEINSVRNVLIENDVLVPLIQIQEMGSLEG